MNAVLMQTAAGSAACAIGGFAFALPLLRHVVRASATQLAPGTALAVPVALCALIGAAVESLPIPVEGGDNVTVPLAVALVASLLF